MKPRKYYYVVCPHCKEKRAVFINGRTYTYKYKRCDEIETKEYECPTCRRRRVSKHIDSIITRSEVLNDKFDSMLCDMKGTCSVIKAHHELLLDDPERLTSEFIINLTCGDDGVKKYRKKRNGVTS
jgi:hypothetical protein